MVVKRAPATAVCLGILGLISAAEWALGAFENPLLLLGLGANSSFLVRAGDWPRLITGNLLHADLVHLFFNGLALVSLGRPLEPLLGTRRFLFLFLVACCGGALFSALFTGALIAVGASTGIVGLFGAGAAAGWRAVERWDPPARGRYLVKQLLWTLFLLGLPALIVPNADHFGHIGGLLAGVAVTLLLVPSIERLGPHAPPPERWIAAGAAVLTVLFLGAGVLRAVEFARKGMTPTVTALLEHGELPPELVNDFAWTIAIDPAASAEELDQARVAMAWAWSGKPGETDDAGLSEAARDTLATLLYRLGELDSAIELEHGVLTTSEDEERIGFYASQLARFEWARRQTAGSRGEARVLHPPEAGCGPPTDLAVGERSAAVVLDLPSGSDVDVHVVFVREDEPSAFLEAYLDEIGPDGAVVGLDPWRPACGDRAVVTSVGILPSGAEGGPRIWKMDPQVAAFPDPL